MPISREEFDQGWIDLTPDVRAILEANPERALTVEEVRRLLTQGFGREATPKEVEEALDRLVEQRRVERRDLRGALYYAIIRRRSRIGFQRG